MIYSLRVSNSEVTDFYMDILEKAIAIAFGDEVVKMQSGKSVHRFQKDDYVIVASAVDALKCRCKGAKNIITWFQGIVPEESYLKHKSKFKRGVLSLIERYAIKISKVCVCVSKSMVLHFERKYKLSISDKCFIMPCFNEKYEENVFFTPKKYEKNIFTYVGSLTSYQGFEKILEEYKRIESRYRTKVSLLVLTKQIDEAKEKIKSFAISNYEVKYVPKDEVKRELSNVKFGFVLRDDSQVNRVATPTKISSYMAAGVIPIFTRSIQDFWENTQDMSYVLCKDSINYEEKLDDLLNGEIFPKKIAQEYEGFFGRYYNGEYYKEELTKRIQKCLRNKI